MRQTYRSRAAAALDATLDAERFKLGLDTAVAQHYVAYWLDEPRKAPKAALKHWVEYLEMIAREIERRRSA